ncbi:MAG: DUF488 domain-containing protein [candidate division Zixibacteria bacterium]
MRLFTIGYEGRDINKFTGILALNGVEKVVDIRAVPHSRRREFSKKHLPEKLAEAGIEYIHIVELGSPKELREKVKADDDYEFFFIEYEKYLKTRTGTINDLAVIATEKSVCLLCYEKDVNRCHRRIVAERIAEVISGKVEISNL